MNEDKAEKRRRVGRPRSAESHRAILEATLELVATHGVQGASMEAIAAQAGVGKSTIYRRWSSKDELIVAALSEFHVQMKFRDTGHFRADLITSLRDIQQQFEAHPLLQRVFLRVMGEATAQPELLQILYERVLAIRMARMTHFFAQAQTRGELRQDLDPLFAATLILGPLLYNLLIASLFPIPYSVHNLPEQIVDALLPQIGAHVE
ncbi:MAG: TetR/AcrR family transcriptional regulator [Caldilineaceae bacterium]